VNRDQRRIARLRESIYKITKLDELEFARALRAGTRTIKEARRNPRPPRLPVAYLKLDSQKGIAPYYVVG